MGTVKTVAVTLLITAAAMAVIFRIDPVRKFVTAGKVA